MLSLTHISASARAATAEIRLMYSMSGMPIMHMVHILIVLIHSCIISGEMGRGGGGGVFPQ